MMRTGDTPSVDFRAIRLFIICMYVVGNDKVDLKCGSSELYSHVNLSET